MKYKIATGIVKDFLDPSFSLLPFFVGINSFIFSNK